MNHPDLTDLITIIETELDFYDGFSPAVGLFVSNPTALKIVQEICGCI